jgi:hypothetical protein
MALQNKLKDGIQVSSLTEAQDLLDVYREQAELQKSTDQSGQQSSQQNQQNQQNQQSGQSGSFKP